MNVKGDFPNGIIATMTVTQKRVFSVLLVISVLYFLLFIPPNNTGANDQMMISLFEPDEFAQYPIVQKMIAQEETLKQNLINFFIYGHYYYGWTFYAASAFTVLTASFINGGNDPQVSMLWLRQIISVLPMLGALLLLVYTQTKFRSYLKSIGLFILLLSVSAVVENNLWWHVDSLAVFWVALVIFFLDQDDLRFTQNFYLAAAAAGLAAGTKVIGLFFFLAIPGYLLLGIVQNRLTWRTAAIRAAAFVGIMTAVIFVSNPFLIYRSQRTDMIEILARQSTFQNEGWVLSYAAGPASWLPIINRLYGNGVFIALSIFALAVGLWRKETRARHLVIALWAIPFGLYILFVVAIKPTHFFLPILLPVYSSLVGLFDIPMRKPTSWIASGLVLAIIGYQCTAYIQKDIELYNEVLIREETEASLVFYHALEQDVFPRIQTDEELVVFRDVRMYLPDDSRWVVRSYWNANYETIETIEPDLILLWSQRIADYTQEGAQESAVDPAAFEDTYQFYMDVKNESLRGYKLVYRDSEGLLFVSEELYAQYFE